MPKSTIDYHLRYLRKQNLIILKKVGIFTRHYPMEQIGIKDQEALNVLRNKIPLHICLILSLSTMRTRTSFCRQLEKAPSTITFHLNKLIKAGIVQKRCENNKTQYFLCDKEKTEKILIQYKDTLLDDVVVSCYDFAIAWRKTEWIRKYIKLLEKDHEKNMEFFYDMFPHPYHV